MKESQNISFFNSIKAKIVLIIILLNTCILGGFAAYNAFVAQGRMGDDLRNLAQVTATRLSKHLIIPLWDLDKEQVEETLRSEMLEKQIYAIIVRDSDGKAVFAGKERDQSWNVQALSKQIPTATASGMVYGSKNIEKSNEKIGTIEVYLTAKFLQEELRQSIVNVIVSVLVLDMVIFIATLIALQQLVIKPIGKLAEAAESMSMGNLDVSIEIHSADEIGHVGQAMERMKISLQMAMKRLRPVQ